MLHVIHEVMTLFDRWADKRTGAWNRERRRAKKRCDSVKSNPLLICAESIFYPLIIFFSLYKRLFPPMSLVLCFHFVFWHRPKKTKKMSCLRKKIYAKSLHSVWRVFWISNCWNDEYRRPCAEVTFVQWLTQNSIVKNGQLRISNLRNEMWSLFFFASQSTNQLWDFHRWICTSRRAKWMWRVRFLI